MPDETLETTPEETTPPPETETTPETGEETAPESVLNDPVMASIRANLNDLLAQDDTPPAAKKGTETEPKAETETTPETTPAPTEGEPKVSVNRARPVSREDLVELVREMRQPPPPAPAPAAPREEHPGVEYTEEEKDQIEVAEHAAKMNPEKYKNLPTQLRKFFKDQQDYVTEHGNEYGRTFDENDEQWVQFIQSRRPFLSDHDRRKVETELITSKAEERASARFAKEREESAERIRRLEAQPIYQTRKKEAEEELKKSLLLPEDQKLEHKVYKKHLDIANNVADLYWKIRTGVETYDHKNPSHKWLIDFVQAESMRFAKEGGKDRIRDGRQFVPYQQFFGLTKEQQARAWTFTDADIMGVIARSAKREADTAIDAAIKEMAELGVAYVRGNPAKGATKNGAPVQPLKAAVPAPRPGPGVGTTPPKEEGPRPAEDIFATLGLPEPGSLPPI